MHYEVFAQCQCYQQHYVQPSGIPRVYQADKSNTSNYHCTVSAQVHCIRSRSSLTSPVDYELRLAEPSIASV